MGNMDRWTSIKIKRMSRQLLPVISKLTRMRNDLDGSRMKCECCNDLKWSNEQEGRLKMELSGLITKAQRIEKKYRINAETEPECTKSKK